ncbi:MAG: bifunctional nuclease family protein [Bacillota bacterium]
MHVHKVRFLSNGSAAVVFLKPAHDERVLPLMVGPAEATAIAIAAQEMATPRPLTHDLIIEILKRLEMKVARVLIDDLKDGTFYSQITFETKGEPWEIDSRPSDAVALALRSRAPIYVMEHVFEKAAVSGETISE